MPNIYLAYHRLLNEEVGLLFHPGLIEAKFRAVSGGFVDRSLGKLLQNHLESAEDVENVELAIKMLKTDEANYHVRVEVLEELLDEARKRVK